MSVPCVRCVMAGGSCCLNRQIVVTTGDIERISQFLGHREFFTLEPPSPWYLEPGYDPDWVPLVLRSDGLLRVLNRTGQNACGMLTDTGCSLPLEARPRVCQLHPYMYTEQDIIGIDETCPLAAEKDQTAILEEMNMPLDKARFWLRQLYDELNADRSVPAA